MVNYTVQRRFQYLMLVKRLANIHVSTCNFIRLLRLLTDTNTIKLMNKRFIFLTTRSLSCCINNPVFEAFPLSYILEKQMFAQSRILTIA